MKASVLRLGVCAAFAATGCAPVAMIGGAPLERHVLDHAGPAKLAKALADDLRAPDYDHAREPVEVIGLRGLMSESPRLAQAAQPFALLAQAPPPRAPLPVLADLLASPPHIASAEPAAPAQAEAAAPSAPPQFAVVLGRFEDVAIAASVWRELAAADPLAVKGLKPRLAGGKNGFTLLAGPLPDAETAAGRCTAFAALGVTCTSGPFQGKPLAGPGA